MFDDRLFDTIMGEMMAVFGPDVRTDESSLAYNACARIATKLEEVYGDMNLIEANMLPDTMELDYLIRYGAERGITYHYATTPVVKGEFKQAIDIGTQFVCNDYTYTTTELIDGFNYKLTCETEGTEANTNTGELTPSDYVEDYQGGQITEVLVLGTDDEDTETYRARVISSFNSIAFGGNRADYRNFIDEIDGVGGCKPMRRESGSEWVDIYLISSDYAAPSTTLINKVQTAVDPEQNHGEGDGMAPINHNVQIIGATETACAITTKLTLDADYTVTQVQTAIETIISAYLLNLRKAWESNEKTSTIVRISQIESKILTVTGVVDVTGTAINGSAENLVLTYEKIPILGEVTLNV